tara:strand:- start:3111 stop:4178 length:1068 start_codon:yes stop_codon:yes gene_type:complete
MSSERHQLLDLLNKRFGRSSGVFTSRAATAIYLLLVALARPGTAVAIPAITCPAVAYPVFLAGYVPVFCDVNLADFNITRESLEALSTDRPISVVIAIHSFGHRLETGSIREWCDENRAFLLEDVCQIFGDADFDARGNAVLVSFGHTKPVDCGYGGALHSNDKDLIGEVERVSRDLPLKRDLDEAYRVTYYQIRKLYRKYPVTRSLAGALVEPFADTFIHSANFEHGFFSNVLAKLNRLEDAIAGRRVKAAIYAEAFANLPVRLPDSRIGSVPWRFTYLTERIEDCQRLTESLREANFHASNWYPSLAMDFGHDTDSLPVATRFENSVINLWVDETVDTETVERAARHVAAFWG